MGVLASTVANAHRDPEKVPTPFTANDFLYTFQAGFEREALDDDDANEEEIMQAEAWLESMTLSLGGSVQEG